MEQLTEFKLVRKIGELKLYPLLNKIYLQLSRQPSNGATVHGRQGSLEKSLFSAIGLCSLEKDRETLTFADYSKRNPRRYQMILPLILRAVNDFKISFDYDSFK